MDEFTHDIPLLLRFSAGREHGRTKRPKREGVDAGQCLSELREAMDGIAIIAIAEKSLKEDSINNCYQSNGPEAIPKTLCLSINFCAESRLFTGRRFNWPRALNAFAAPRI